MVLFHKTTSTSEKIQENMLSPSDDSLNELRKLLLGPMQERFDKMQQLLQMLENQELQAEEVSKVLPEAMLLRSSRDTQIIRAMEYITEEAIKSSVQRDPRNLVSVLVPVMLPAIRKAITSLIKEMIQNFSATLEHGLSLRGLRWRYEAFKTKKPFGEVALLHSLIYQVEQVFLIHKETSLVLQSMVSKDTIVVQDPDMVSSMLSAIQDFTRDSFGATQDEGLENLEFGDRSIWIEQTSLVILAAVVWGNAPVELRTILRESLNAIHFEHLDHLRSFDGDTDLFESAKIHLSNCLKSQIKEKNRHPIILWFLISILIFFIGYGSFFAIQNHIRWKNYLENLHNEPGIVITETDRRQGKYYVYGLKDTLAADPVKLLKDSQIEPDKVIFDWELYHSSHPDFMIRRIKKILNPPESVTFELKNGILRAEGTAPLQWIIESEKLVEAIPGVLSFEKDKIVVFESRQIDIFKEEIEETLFLFDAVAVKIKPGQEDKIENLVNHINAINSKTAILGKHIRLEIIGHTDSVGTEERNLEISQKRAEELYSILISKGVPQELFTTIKGVASHEPLREEVTEQDRDFNRSVNFRVIIGE